MNSKDELEGVNLLFLALSCPHPTVSYFPEEGEMSETLLHPLPPLGTVRLWSLAVVSKH